MKRNSINNICRAGIVNLRVLMPLLWAPVTLTAALIGLFVLSSCAGFRQIIFHDPDVRREKDSEEGVYIKVREREEAPAEIGERDSEMREGDLTPGKGHREIVSDSVNVRAGGNLNYEILANLNKGDRVVILGSSFDWYEIELPAGCVVWVYGEYVSTEGAPPRGEKISGTITGDSVRVRAKPGLMHTVLMKLNKGEKVTVVDSEGAWVGIVPPDECTGWVFKNYIK